MKFSEFLWNEFIYGGHYLSLGAPAIALFTMIMLGVTIRLEFLLIAYLGAQCIYNYNHYSEFTIDALSDSFTAQHIKRYLKIHPFIVAIYGILFFVLLLFLGNLNAFLFGCFLLLLGLLYTIGGKNIAKRIVGLKSLYIAVSWAFIIPLTVIYCSYYFDILVLVLFLFVFFRFLVDTIFYDIKDIKSDKKEGILTFASLLGKDTCLDFLQIWNLISFLPLLIGIFFHILPTYSFFVFIIFFYSFYYIYKARDKNADIRSLTYIIVDAEYCYWPFLLFLGLLIPLR